MHDNSKRTTVNGRMRSQCTFAYARIPWTMELWNMQFAQCKVDTTMLMHLWNANAFNRMKKR